MKCQICGEQITKEKIKLEAKGNPNRIKNIKQDYNYCRMFRYCIECIRAKQQTQQ